MCFDITLIASTEWRFLERNVELFWVALLVWLALNRLLGRFRSRTFQYQGFALPITSSSLKENRERRRFGYLDAFVSLLLYLFILFGLAGVKEAACIVNLYIDAKTTSCIAEFDIYSRMSAGIANYRLQNFTRCYWNQVVKAVSLFAVSLTMVVVWYFMTGKRRGTA